MRTDVIAQFRGEFSFLSNFYEGEFGFRNHRFPTAEHAFVWCKSFYADGAAQQAALDASDLTPGQIKKFGRKLEIDVTEWDKYKVMYMRQIVHSKFSGVTGLAGKLINTGASLLVEGNTWNDTFWGRCNGKGLNILGSILMEERGYWLWHNEPPF